MNYTFERYARAYMRCECMRARTYVCVCVAAEAALLQHPNHFAFSFSNSNFDSIPQHNRRVYFCFMCAGKQLNNSHINVWCTRLAWQYCLFSTSAGRSLGIRYAAIAFNLLLRFMFNERARAYALVRYFNR